MAVTLTDAQAEAMERMDNGCILRGGVGTGKSLTAIAYYYHAVCEGGWDDEGRLVNPRVPTELVIVTAAKKRDGMEWQSELAKYGLSEDPECSVGYVRCTVDGWNNVAKYTDKEGCFFIFDEQRLVGNGSWVKAFYDIAKRNQWVMLSATPGDRWLDYIPVFIANGFYKNRTEFVRTHVVFNNYSKFPKVDHYVETSRLEALRRRILVDLPQEKHTVRQLHQVVCDYDRAAYHRVKMERWNVDTDEPCKDVQEWFAMQRRIVNRSTARGVALLELAEQHPKMIVFYNFDHERDQILALADSAQIPRAEWNGRKHQDIPDTDSWLYLVQYAAGAEAWNCVETDTIVFWSQNYSYRATEQSMGRIDRMNTPYTFLHYYFLTSDSPIDKAIGASLRAKKDFNMWGELTNAFDLAVLPEENVTVGAPWSDFMDIGGDAEEC